MVTKCRTTTRQGELVATSPAAVNLAANQRQLDMDGCEVGVSRQAVDEVLAEHAAMLAALQAVAPYFEGEHAYDHPHCIQLRTAIAKATGAAHAEQSP